MDNELITKKSWWKSWKWILPISALVIVGIFISLCISEIDKVKTERENGLAFDQAKWKMKDDAGYLYRNEMLKDIMNNETLRKLNKKDVINLLGQPERIDKEYLFYTVTQQHMGFLPLHTTTLVIKLGSDGKENAIMIHE